MKYPTKRGTKKDRPYHAWLTKIIHDPARPVTTSLIKKCGCRLQGQLTRCGQYAACQRIFVGVCCGLCELSIKGICPEH